MLFSGGFVLSRVEVDTLVNLLRDTSTGRMKQLTSEELCERFSGIDTDGSGCEYDVAL